MKAQRIALLVTTIWVYARTSKSRELTFDFAEGLGKNNLLMVDRETDSVWSQLHGRVLTEPETISGPQARSGCLKSAENSILQSLKRERGSS